MTIFKGCNTLLPDKQSTPRRGFFIAKLMNITVLSLLALISGLNGTNMGLSRTPTSGLQAIDTVSTATFIAVAEKEVEAYTVFITAYSSSPDETDDTPHVTASGGRVRDGIIAANFLPFGTKVLIPSIFGEKVFIVEDRMHRRKTNNIDIWMPSKKEALIFGITNAEIIVLEEFPRLKYLAER